MGIIINGISRKKYVFEGPYVMRSSLENAPGVFALFRKNGRGYELIDLEGSEKVYDYVVNKDNVKEQCNKFHCELNYAAFYVINEKSTPIADIEEDIKEYYKL